MPEQTQASGLYRLTQALSEDIAMLRVLAGQVAQGVLDEKQFKAFRVPLGVYEQRQSGTYMLRARLLAGAVLPRQMRALAEVSRGLGNGVLHFTTRQDIQVHGVPLASIADGLAAIRAAGLSTKGSGGNTVRTIASCPHSGVCASEAFDVAPHVVALTEFLLADPASCTLPRKYKLAVSGCGRDCAGAAVNDLGLIASVRDGVEGFTVYVAGGMGARSAVGQLLEEFVPTADAYLVAEAVKRVFAQHGNRENRNRARLRFLVEDLGFDAFRALYTQELAALGQSPPDLPELRPLPHPNPPGAATASAGAPPDAQFLAWQATAVAPQAQAGFSRVLIPLPLGDITADALEGLAEVTEEYGEGLLRATQTQNALLRWVTNGQLPALYARLNSLGLAAGEAPLLQNLVPCTGAGTCRLGICLSRGLAAAIAQRLRRSPLDLHSLGDLQLSISGCPNSCGRHLLADIGFSGAARRIEGRTVPHYAIHLGGSVGDGLPRLAEKIGTLPARAVPGFLADLLAHYATSSQRPDFAAFAAEEGKAIEAVLTQHQSMPSFAEAPSYYADWGAEEAP